MTAKQIGGKREGAGRKSPAPELSRVGVPLRLPAWMVVWIDSQGGSRASVIEAAMLKAYHLKPPKGKPL